MQRFMHIALIAALSALATGCVVNPTTGGLVTPWGAAGIHSFKPQEAHPQPNAAKVDKQVAQLLDDESTTGKEADVRVATAR